MAWDTSLEPRHAIAADVVSFFEHCFFSEKNSSKDLKGVFGSFKINLIQMVRMIKSSLCLTRTWTCLGKMLNGSDSFNPQSIPSHSDLPLFQLCPTFFRLFVHNRFLLHSQLSSLSILQVTPRVTGTFSGAPSVNLDSGKTSSPYKLYMFNPM